MPNEQKIIEAASKLRQVIENEGPVPEYHRRILARHRREWPALWQAIDWLITEQQAQ